jgi:hypothetical protein
MKKLLIVTQVFHPEDFIINDIALYLSEFFEVTVITRAPAYPKGKLFKNYRNRFESTKWREIRVLRYPIFLNYSENILSKIANVFWQPLIVGLLVNRIKFDRLFVYQVGSIYDYSFIWGLKNKNRTSVIWSQDLWPEAAFEFGFLRLNFYQNILHNATRKILRKFSVVLVQNRSFKKHYWDKYKIESKVVYNFSPAAKVKCGTDRSKFDSLVYAGNIGSAQNLDEIISVFLKICSLDLGIRNLEVYGDGSAFKYIREKYKNNKNIYFHGMVSRREIEKALKNCRFVIFSLIEGTLRKTIPSRFQFYYNSNVPIIYVGDGAVSEELELHGGGISLINLHSTNIRNVVSNFDSRIMETRDCYNKDEILKEIMDHIT